MNPWTKAVAWVDSQIPLSWKQIPPLTWLAHTLMVVFGMVPVPLGPFGIWYWLETGHGWLWLLASGMSLVCYWIREYRQNGLEPKSEFERHYDSSGSFVAFRRPFIDRYDPQFDVGWPTLAYGMQLGILGWLWWVGLG